jgi:hypothetical protein
MSILPYTAQRGYNSYSQARQTLLAARKKGHLGWITRSGYSWEVKYYRLKDLMKHLEAQGMPLATSNRRARVTKLSSFRVDEALTKQRDLIEAGGLAVVDIETSASSYGPPLYQLHGYTLQQIANHLLHEGLYVG